MEIWLEWEKKRWDYLGWGGEGGIGCFGLIEVLDNRLMRRRSLGVH